MITPEDDVIKGFSNPLKRLFTLFIVSYFSGVLYPLPETLFHLIIGPKSFGITTVTHTSQYVDWKAIPFIGTLFASTAFLSFPLFFFCIACSALDRWDERKTLTLGAAVSFSLYFARDITSSDELFYETLIFSASTAALYWSSLWLIGLFSK